jgi:7-cyano-7-deazaguanine synthase
VVLLSGGVDSAVAVYDTMDDGYHPLPLFIDYGQVNKWQELRACKELCRKLRLNLRTVFMNISSVVALGGDKSTFEGAYIPARNLVLASLGIMYAEASEADFVVLGLHAGSRYADCSYEFLEAMQVVADKATQPERHLDVKAPFMFMTKKELVLRGKDLRVPFEDTWSCLHPIRPSATPCGVCNGCVDRKRVGIYF